MGFNALSQLLSAALLLILTATAHAQVDFTGVDQFWRIADLLQRDIEPDSAQWNELFATPGYAALEAREKRRAALTLGMRSVFKASFRATRDSILATNTWTARVVRHMQSLPAQRAKLDSLRTALTGARFLDRAAEQAATLLPAGAIQKYGTPKVAFLFFLPDGRGYPDLLVADLANIANKTNIIPFFAHEATHFYLARIARERQLRPMSRGDSAVITMLNKLYEESMGDQHDKADYVHMSDAQFAGAPMDAAWRDYMTQYRTHYQTARQEIARMNDALNTAAARGDDVVKAVADSLNRSLPLEGRPVGFYITEQIRRHAADRAIVGVAGDVVAWVNAYNAIATQKLITPITQSVPQK